MTVFLIVAGLVVLWYIGGIINIAYFQIAEGDDAFDRYMRRNTLVGCYLGGFLLTVFLLLGCLAEFPVRYGTILGRTIGRMISNDR